MGNNTYSTRMKHITPRFFYLEELVANDKVGTDFFTKCLEGEVQRKLDLNQSVQE